MNLEAGMNTNPLYADDNPKFVLIAGQMDGFGSPN